MAGFALEVGDRLVINDEEVIFTGWVDQSQTAIEVKPNDSESSKVIRAREINSLGRSPATTDQRASTTDVADANPYAHEQSRSDSSDNQEVTQEANSGDRSPTESVTDASHSEQPQPEPEAIADTREPEYNAWEVWTYLERQRVKTLKLLNTFRAEWEANRFVREAERSTPPNLRVHYEVRPIWLDESELKDNRHHADDSTSSKDSEDLHQKDYGDAIDVEVVTDNF